MNAENELESLANEYGDGSAVFAPPWGMATLDQCHALCANHECTLPKSFILYQTAFMSRIPGINGLRLVAAPESEPYLSLSELFVEAREWGLPPFYIPFYEDNADLLLFDSRVEAKGSEFPLVQWFHDEPIHDDLPHVFEHFLHWYRSVLEDQRGDND